MAIKVPLSRYLFQFSNFVVVVVISDIYVVKKERKKERRKKERSFIFSTAAYMTTEIVQYKNTI